MIHRALQFTTSYLVDSLDLFRYYKKLVGRAMAQVTDEQPFAVLDGEMNSIAVIVKPIAVIVKQRSRVATGSPNLKRLQPRAKL